MSQFERGDVGSGGRQYAVALLAMAWIALTAAAPATALTWDAGKRPPVAVLAGDGASWFTRLPRGGRALYAARPGQRPRRVDSFPRPGEPGNFIGGAFAGSGSTVVLESETYVPGTRVDGATSGGVALYAGGFGDGLDSLGRCDAVLGTALGRIDVSGTTVAFQRCDMTVEVRDLAGGTMPLVLGHDVHAVRIAGRYVAWLEGTYTGSPQSQADIVVYDRTKGAEAYRIPASAIAQRVTSLSLQSDGKVAFVFDPTPNDTNARELVAWASRSHPVVHKLRLPRRLSYTVTLASDRVVFARYSSAGDRTHEQLGVSDLKGRSRLIVRHGSGLGIDYDGKRIAYAIRSCHRYTVIRQLLSARKHPSSQSCP
jgi:hypothetical protein